MQVIIAPVLAHAGAWDEILLFAGPVIAALLWVRWAEKRARLRKQEAAEAAVETEDQASSTTD